MAVDQFQDVKEAYLRTRELIKQGTNPYQPRLLVHGVPGRTPHRCLRP